MIADIPLINRTIQFKKLSNMFIGYLLSIV